MLQAPSSSASGLYQFIRSTWIGEGGTWGPTLRPAFGGLKPSPEEQLARARTFTAKNAAYLRSRDVPINRATLYAAHFLGPVTAGSILAAGKGERADLIAGVFYVLAGGFGGYAVDSMELMQFGNVCWLVGSLISGTRPILALCRPAAATKATDVEMRNGAV